MKKIINHLKFYYHSSGFFRNLLLKRWGDPNNSHRIKELAILEYNGKNDFRIFIETGTYLGEMVYSLRDKFHELHTIELSPYLYNTAKRRFRKTKNITFLHGDSGKLMPVIVSGLNEPGIFWLDGHYSGGITMMGESETPILKELEAIFASPLPHIILIDDARCFGSVEFPDYPSIPELEKFINKMHPGVEIEIRDDIIRITRPIKTITC